MKPQVEQLESRLTPSTVNIFDAAVPPPAGVPGLSVDQKVLAAMATAQKGGSFLTTTQMLDCNLPALCGGNQVADALTDASGNVVYEMTLGRLIDASARSMVRLQSLDGENWTVKDVFTTGTPTAVPVSQALLDALMASHVGDVLSRAEDLEAAGVNPDLVAIPDGSGGLQMQLATVNTTDTTVYTLTSADDDTWTIDTIVNVTTLTPTPGLVVLQLG